MVNMKLGYVMTMTPYIQPTMRSRYGIDENLQQQQPATQFNDT